MSSFSFLVCFFVCDVLILEVPLTHLCVFDLKWLFFLIIFNTPVFVEGPDEPASAEAAKASEHEPLRQQEERIGEHAGCGLTDG